MHKFLLLLIGLTFAIGQNKAQSSACQLTLEGSVIDISSQKPINGLSIRLNDSVYSTTTTQDGRFLIENVCPRKYVISIHGIGYEPFVETIELKNGKTVLQFSVQNNSIAIEEVAVQGKQAESKTLQTYRLSEQEKAERKGKNLSEQLTALAGVTLLSTGTTIQKPVINGLHSQRVLVLNQGVRQEGQQWGAEHAPEIDPFTAGYLEVSKGAQAVRYGADALAGVVLLTPSKIDTTKILVGQVDVIGISNGRGLTSNVQLEGNRFFVPRLSWRLQASAKKQGNSKTADYYLGNTGVEELNFSGLFQYALPKGKLEAYISRFSTSMGIFAGAHASTGEDILARIANGRPFETYSFSYDIGAPKQEVSHTLAKLKYDHHFSPNSSLSLQYGFQQNHRQEYDVRRVESDDVPMADMLLRTQTLDAIYAISNYKFGLQGTIQINNNVPGTGTTPIIPNFDNHTLGAFAIGEFQRKNYLIELGLRYDYRYFDVAGYRYDYANPDENGVVQQYLLTDQRQFHNVSGTAGISYPISERLIWKSNAGLAWRAPSANELYSDGLHHGSGTYEIGDPNLKSEKGLKWVNHFGYQWNRLQVHADVYGQYIADYIYANPDPDSIRQTIRGTFPVFTFHQNNALFYGIDAQARYKFLQEKLIYSVQFSLVRAKNIDSNTFLPYIPSDRLSQSLQWNLSENNLLTKNYLKLTHDYVSQQTRYEPESDYAYPPGAYHLLAFHAGTSLPIKQQALAIHFAVENLTNNLYKDYMDRFRYYAHQLGRNISLRITYNF
ncbi:TonB-dependent receptor [Sphingobacterium hungaricum]|uniref:TonB-dependent receptor n=1 Tax=Sphingobacterium hungaricum TaxID=2082723 RepID=A0A928YRH4_9SPHI|nr:TonB-dependent receptor [Sphingobacterium hungaricum]MBE8715301.1 TonB-dependent receptor [Sphingobacterium hungaricum]